MSRTSDESTTREVRIVRSACGRKILSADDWRARTKAEAIQTNLGELRAKIREEVELEVREELADAFVQAALLSQTAATPSEQLADMAARCAERLVEGELRAAPERIRDVVASVLEQAQDDGPVAIVVHPDSLRHFSDVTRLPVRGDPSLEVGDCVIEVRRGCFDGRLRTRTERLVRYLHEFERVRDA